MSKPLRNRNRRIVLIGNVGLAPRISPQLPESGCAQKESNLQPAYSDALSNSREIGSAPYSAVVTSATEPPTKPESGESNRYESVTASTRFRLSSHPIFPALESFGLALRMERVRP